MIAPLLSDQFHVVAYDLSGSGDSGWRERYSSELFAREALAVADAAGLGPRPSIVGHSFGGMVALESGHMFGADLAGVVMVDFTIQPPHTSDAMVEAFNRKMSLPVRPTRVYEDRQAALSRFRLVPEQECSNPFLISYLAEHSLREVEGGWTWKFDPGMFSHLDRADRNDGKHTLLNLKCPAAFIMAEQSLDYSTQSVEFTREITQGVIPMFHVPGTRHHLMLDDPIAVTMALKGVLSAWTAGAPPR